MADVTESPPPRALISPRKPHARGLLYFHHGLLSWYFHHLSAPVLKGGVFLNHIVEVIVPFGLFGPQPIAAVAGGLIIGHQLLLIASGNFSFLNYLTIALCLTAFSDAVLMWVIPFWQEKKRTGSWWNRELIGDYLPPMSVIQLKDLDPDSNGA